MGRRWVYFNQKTIEAEFRALPERDEAKLLALMEHYREVSGNPSPAQIDSYGNGIYRLRHIKPSYSGRALFFIVDTKQGTENLVVLAVYKKEGNKAPQTIIETARERMKNYKLENAE